MSDVHIGSIIKNVVNERKASLTGMAEVLDIHYGSISRVYNNPSIQISQLEKLSKYLQYDFFAVYSANLNLKTLPISHSEVKKSESEILLEEKMAENEALKKEIAALKLEEMKKENGYLKQINGLLMKK